jgi:hypothetical protein
MKNHSLNIAVVTDAIFPFNKGGKETRIFQITTELNKLGHEVHIYTMKWWKGDDVIILDGITYHAISRHYPLYHGNRRSITQSIFFAAGLMVVTVDHPENAARHLISAKNGLIAQVSADSIARSVNSLLDSKLVSSRVAAPNEYSWPILANKLSESYQR